MLLELTLVLSLQSAGLAAIVGGGFVFHLGFGGVGIGSEENGVSRARGEMDGRGLKRAKEGKRGRPHGLVLAGALGPDFGASLGGDLVDMAFFRGLRLGLSEKVG